MKLFFILFFLVLLSNAFACEVSLPGQMLVSGNIFETAEVKSNNCSQNTLNELNNILTNIDGRPSTAMLSKMVSDKGLGPIRITPQFIHIRQLKNLIHEQLQSPTGVQVKNVYLSQNVISFAEGDRIEIRCLNCLFAERQPLEIIINGFDGTTKIHQAKADFKKMVRAYRVLTNLQSFSNIDTGNILKEEHVESIPYTDLVTDLDALKYYKTNKPIKAGTLLRRSDLNAINIVKAGLRTDVIFENQMVRIKTSGISRSTGGIGDLVEIFHPQKNKKYQGKVIDINKVLVEL